MRPPVMLTVNAVLYGLDIGAVSASVIAMDNNHNVCYNKHIGAKGLPLESVKPGMTRLKEAVGCSEMYEIIRVVLPDNRVLAVWGDKCGRYAGTSKASRIGAR